MKITIALLLGLMITQIPSQAFAKGPGLSGGGNAVGDELLDFAEARDLTPFDPSTAEAFQTIVDPLLKNLGQKLPGFEQDMRTVLSVEKRKWLYVDQPLSKANCENYSLVDNGISVVACQDKHKIIVYRPWFQRVSTKNQAGLLVHEAVRGLAMFYNKYESLSPDIEEGIREVVRTIFNNPSIDADKLNNFLVSKIGSNGYITMEALNALNARVDAVNAKLPGVNDLIKKLAEDYPFDSNCVTSNNKLRKYLASYERIMPTISKYGSDEDYDLREHITLSKEFDTLKWRSTSIRTLIDEHWSLFGSDDELYEAKGQLCENLKYAPIPPAKHYTR